jgi:hypothetical protein
VILVAYNSAEVLRTTLPALQRELREGDEIIVVDNASLDGSAEVAREYARVIENPGNDGFPAACNRGAAEAAGDLLVFLNPDAEPRPGWGEAIRAPAGGRLVAWQAVVECAGAINTAGNPVHFTGVTWAGDSPGSLSGACLAVRAAEFRAIGGFEPSFFLYHEDVDLSLRLRLAGGELGVEPAARVEHAYEFDKGPDKWRLLERNRWFVLLRCWPGTLLALVAPALLATELAIWCAALAGGWAPQKARATRELVAALPRLLRERRGIQSRRRIDATTFAAHLTADLGSPYLAGAARANPLLRAYWAAVTAVLHRSVSTQSTG